jgi:hypothetical protein
VFACVVHDDAAELESAIDAALEPFAEYHRLQKAFGRRAVIEQAKGFSRSATRSTPRGRS